MTTDAVLTEGPVPGVRDWITRWYCPVPPPGCWFRVLRDEWTTEPRGNLGRVSVRSVYEIQRAEDM